MMTVPHYIDASKVHGLGLFASEAIHAGAHLWRYEEGDRKVPLDGATDQMKHYGYVNPRYPDKLVVCGDCASFWNFPPAGTAANAVESPQLCYNSEAVIIAARDIAAGEELLIDTATDADASRKLNHS